MKLDELQKSVIKDFWDMIVEHKDACMVQWFEEDESLMLYIKLEYEGMKLLNEISESLDVEDSIVMSLHLNDIMIDAYTFIDGYGITIEELWEEKPDDLVQDWD